MLPLAVMVMRAAVDTATTTRVSSPPVRRLLAAIRKSPAIVMVTPAGATLIRPPVSMRRVSLKLRGPLTVGDGADTTHTPSTTCPPTVAQLSACAWASVALPSTPTRPASTNFATIHARFIAGLLFMVAPPGISVVSLAQGPGWRAAGGDETCGAARQAPRWTSYRSDSMVRRQRDTTARANLPRGSQGRAPRLCADGALGTIDIHPLRWA